MTVDEQGAPDVPHAHPGSAPLLYVVKQLELVCRARLDELLRPDGVTALQYTALTVLARHPSLTSADLARMSFTRAQSAADLVAGLLRRGLVERSPDPANRRRLLIDLTPAGRDLLAQHADAVAELDGAMLDDLSPYEAQLFRSLLRRARHSLEALDPPAAAG